MTDYSPEAIARRLRLVSEATRVGLSLRNAGGRVDMRIRDSLHSIDFGKAFRALTGTSPLKWQRRLFQRMLGGNIPTICDLPTGLGKTSIIPIWLLALVSQIAEGARVVLPRRLVYIINRRTVVDQATTVVELLRRRILGLEEGISAEARETLGFLRQVLHQARAFEEGPCLAISTLRGEFADNEEWKADPARASIVVGTIDMIGSKLLFSGYGDGPYRRAHHAGLVGQDSLIVHDEAHLTPAFGKMLRFVGREQSKFEEPRPIVVTELSATPLRAAESVLSLEPEDEEDDLVRQRLDARKRMRIHVVEEQTIIDAMAETAALHESSPSKVLLYVRAPEDAQRLAKSLEKRLGRDAQERIALLTGTIRGRERDDLVKKDPVYLTFLEGRSGPRSVYLVSTSAGEVGIDLDADHLVCDLTTLDSMVQRLGRVNRRGGDDRSADVDLVAAVERSTKDPDPCRVATLNILKTLPSLGNETYDSSPRALRAMMASLTDAEKEAAWSAQAETLPLTDVILDAWSLTSIRRQLPGRPEVTAYLHGLTNDPPETHVAWRWEVIRLDQAEISPEKLTDWFRACRIEARERLRDRTTTVQQKLEALLEEHRKKKDDWIDFPVIVLDERGEIERALLSQIVKSHFDLRYRTVVLPVEAGGLNGHGLLDATSLEPVPDVGDHPGSRERAIATGLEPLVSNLAEKYRLALRVPSEGEEEGESESLILLVGREQSALDHPETTAACQSLAGHSQQIALSAGQIALALGLTQQIGDALIVAARRHDDGKAHPVWQRYACNRDLGHPLAKSTRYLHGRALAGYRHEFGSLLKAVNDTDLLAHPERDLILHLITSHHGWGRPHFEPRAFDSLRFTTTAENEHETHEVMRRFARLQRRFGRWGLVWLESLLRSADIAASRAAVESTSEEAVAS